MLQDGLVTALGTMSGPSLDGVDAAIIVTDGVDIAGFGGTVYRPYSAAERTFLRQHMGLWPEDELSDVPGVIEFAHWEAMFALGYVDIAGFHGQTLAHNPGERRTHQCGNGQNLADALGYPIAWDFRSADIAAGGQGAPITPFFHFALAKLIEAEGPVVFLNLGGVGNLTWVDPAFDDPADDGALFAFDTGPATVLLDDAIRLRLGLTYDPDGALAGIGRSDTALVTDFMQHPYFALTPPKSLDRDAFADVIDKVADLPDADAVATLTAFVVASVTHAMSQCPVPPARILVTGGGRRNRTILGGLALALECEVTSVESVGLNGDMLGAQAIGYLAVRTARGLPISAPGTTGIPEKLTCGQLALPTRPD